MTNKGQYYDRQTGYPWFESLHSKSFKSQKCMHKLFSFVNGAFSKGNDLICTNIINPKTMDLKWFDHFQK